jgi:hypothetical protein
MRSGRATAFATADNIQPLTGNGRSSSGIAPENATYIVCIATAALVTKTSLKF